MKAEMGLQPGRLAREVTKLPQWRTMKGRILRMASVLAVKRETWERHSWLQAVLVFGFFLSSAGAGVNWYEWAAGRGTLHLPLLWSLPIVGILAVVPRRRVLVFAVLGLYVIYGLKAVLLNREPRAWYLVAAAAVLLVLLLITTPRDWR